MATAVGIDVGGIVEGAGNVLRNIAQDAISTLDPVKMLTNINQMGAQAEVSAKAVYRLAKSLKTFTLGDDYKKFRSGCIPIIHDVETILPLIHQSLTTITSFNQDGQSITQAGYLQRLLNHDNDSRLIGDIDFMARYTNAKESTNIMSTITEIDENGIETEKQIMLIDFINDIIFGELPENVRDVGRFDNKLMGQAMILNLIHKVYYDLNIVSQNLTLLYKYWTRRRELTDPELCYTITNARWKFIYLINCFFYLLIDLDPESVENNTYRIPNMALCNYLEMKANQERYSWLIKLLANRMVEYTKSFNKNFMTGGQVVTDSTRGFYEEMIHTITGMNRERLRLHNLVTELSYKITEMEITFGLPRDCYLFKDLGYKVDDDGNIIKMTILGHRVLGAMALGCLQDVLFRVVGVEMESDGKPANAGREGYDSKDEDNNGVSLSYALRDFGGSFSYADPEHVKLIYHNFSARDNVITEVTVLKKWAFSQNDDSLGSLFKYAKRHTWKEVVTKIPADKISKVRNFIKNISTKAKGTAYKVALRLEGKEGADELAVLKQYSDSNDMFHPLYELLYNLSCEIKAKESARKTVYYSKERQGGLLNILSQLNTVRDMITVPADFLDAGEAVKIMNQLKEDVNRIRILMIHFTIKFGITTTTPFASLVQDRETAKQIISNSNTNNNNVTVVLQKEQLQSATTEARSRRSRQYADEEDRPLISDEQINTIEKGIVGFAADILTNALRDASKDKEDKRAPVEPQTSKGAGNSTLANTNNEGKSLQDIEVDSTDKSKKKSKKDKKDK